MSRSINKLTSSRPVNVVLPASYRSRSCEIRVLASSLSIQCKKSYIHSQSNQTLPFGYNRMDEEEVNMRGRLSQITKTSFVPSSSSLSASARVRSGSLDHSFHSFPSSTHSPLIEVRTTRLNGQSRTPSPHFSPLLGTQLPKSDMMTKRFRSTGIYPSPSPELIERDDGSFNKKLLQAEERLISKELKTKSEGKGRFIRIVEVSARDGLQNLPGPPVPTELKRELVERLLDAGVRNIEVGSFVRGDWIPQMADTSKLLPTLPSLTGKSLPLGIPSPPSSRPQTPESENGSLINESSLKHIIDNTIIPSSADQVHFPVLVPNMKGLENLIKLQEQHTANGGGKLTDEVAVFVSATEAFSQANNHAPLSKILSSLPPVIDKARSLGYRVRGYVSCVITCPYSGPTPPQDVIDVAMKLLEMGCYEISLGDTTGEGDPESWRKVWRQCEGRGIDMSRVAAHCHDTFSLALSSIISLLPYGLTSIDSSLAGLGGCPYSPGATGNVPTEDVVYTLHKLGYETGINLDKLVETGNWLSSSLKLRNESRVGRAIWARRKSRELKENQSNGLIPKGEHQGGSNKDISMQGQETEDGM